jgi:hypothetical protein
MSTEKIYSGRVQSMENKFGGVETHISFGPQDWEKLGIKCSEWKNLILKSNKEGKPYLELNTWQPKAETAAEESLPF